MDMTWRGEKIKVSDFKVGNNIAITFTDEMLTSISPTPLTEVVKAENGIEARCTVDVISKVKNITLNPTDIVLHAGETKNNSAGMYNAVNAETGEIGWIDGSRKVEVIAQ